MSTKLKAGALVVVLLGLAALLLVQQHESRRLLAEKAALQIQLDQLAALRDSHEQLAQQLKAALGGTLAMGGVIAFGFGIFLIRRSPATTLAN